MAEAMIHIKEGKQLGKIEIHACFYGGMDSDALSHTTALQMIRHKASEPNAEALLDMNVRLVQQLQEELDQAERQGQSRPDLRALIDDNDQLLTQELLHVTH